MAFSQYKVTPYLVYLVFITTLGPLQFGYHLVRQMRHSPTDIVNKSPGRTQCPSIRNNMRTPKHSLLRRKSLAAMHSHEPDAIRPRILHLHTRWSPGRAAGRPHSDQIWTTIRPTCNNHLFHPRSPRDDNGRQHRRDKHR